MSNLALRLAGPATLTYKGATFASQGDIALNLSNDTFDVSADAYGVLDARSSAKRASLSFTPVGEWSNLHVLWPDALQVIGNLSTPVRSFVAGDVNITTDILTVTGHGWLTGAAVRAFSFGTLPAGLVAGTLYYVRQLTPNTLSLHSTRAGALTNTSLVNMTSQGTDTHRLIEQEPLVIVTAEGERYTFHVAALAKLPAITCSAVATLIGEVTFDLFRIAGLSATAVNSLFTLDTAAYAPPAITPESIFTLPFTLTWGAAPWSALETVDGLRWTFDLSLEDVLDDTQGVLGKRVANLAVNLAARPLGITPAQVNARLLLQGAGAQRGGTLATADDLVVASDEATITGTAGALISGPQAFGRTADRIGELQWRASRRFIAGVPQPLFSVS
jgi:hypothetical protein